MSNRNQESLFDVVRKKVKQLRLERGLTQEDLAGRMGILSMDVCRFERGVTHRDMRLSRVESYARALNVRPEELITADSDLRPTPASTPSRAAARKPKTAPRSKAAKASKAKRAKVPAKAKAKAKAKAPARKAAKKGKSRR